jgi:hypothetical protein
LATTWNVPPAGPPPKTILFLANDSAEKAKVIVKTAQTPITTVKNLFLISNPPEDFNWLISVLKYDSPSFEGESVLGGS